MDTLQAMRCFVNVVATGSFKEAAARLNLSSKLVSKQVAKLEEHLGVRLLHRTTRAVSLTEAGTTYYEGCVSLVASVDELEALVHPDSKSPSGRLRISAPTTFTEKCLMPLFVEFQRRYPHILINLSLSDHYEGIVEEGFDLAIRIGRLADSGLIASKIASTAVVLCASPGYLSGAPKLNHPSDLKEHKCVIDTNFRDNGTWTFNVGGDTIHLRLPEQISVNSAEAARKYALASGGIAKCPLYSVEDDIESGDLVQILPDAINSTLDISVLYSSSKFLPPKVRVFVDYLKNEMKRQSK